MAAEGEVLDSGNVAPEEEVEFSPSEEQAMSHGWRPKDQWSGEEADWVSADEFNRRGELLGRIVHQKKELSQLKKTVSALKEHYTTVQETEYNRALNELKSRKREALENDEHEVIVEVDDAIDDLKRTRQEIAQEEMMEEPSQEFVQWSGANTWYNQDPELTAVADGIAKAYIAANGNTTVDNDVLTHVSTQIRKRYPEKFGGSTQRAGSPVESASNGQSRSRKGTQKKFTSKDLDDTQRDIMRTIVQTGVLTEEEYISDLVKAGVLS